MNKKEEILTLFPVRIRERFLKAAEKADELQEIRISAEKPVRVLIRGSEFFVNGMGELVKGKPENPYMIRAGELEMILNHICSYSRYAFEEDVRRGFISVPGGHRIGLCGQTISGEDGSIRMIKYIRSINIRISHEVIGCSSALLPFLISGDHIQNTLLVGPPCSGKTTLLRDLVRQISNGNRWQRGKQIGLVDERSEIAGSYLGIPGNDVGIRTDVMDACPKVQGIMMLIRSMTPEVIAVDEIGSKADMEAILNAEKCGCSVLATIHGYSMEDIERYHSFVHSGFERFVFLKRTFQGTNNFCVRDGKGEVVHV